jgi:hypothetical protein
MTSSDLIDAVIDGYTVAEIVETVEGVPCSGCGQLMNQAAALVGSSIYPPVCFGCVKARHRSVLARGACKCGNRKVVGAPVSQAGRRWIPCNRCLGKIKSLPDEPRR